MNKIKENKCLKQLHLSIEEEDKIVEIAYLIKSSIESYGGLNGNLLYYKNDPIFIDSEEIIYFAISLIKSNNLDNFIKDPDIMNYTIRRNISDNIYCLYLNPQDNTGHISDKLDYKIYQILENIL